MEKMQFPKRPYTVYLNDREKDSIELSDVQKIGEHWVQGLSLDNRWVWIPAATILYMQEVGDDIHE